MIDKRVGMSKKIGNITDKSKVLWFMIYPHLDREGRVAFDDLQDLKVEIIPYFQNWTLKKIEASLNELADIGLINLYPNNKKIAMQFNRFEDFQIGLRKEREAKSEILAQEETPATSGNFRIFALSLRKYKYKEVSKEGSKQGIYYSFDDKKFHNITKEDKELWNNAYPACDIDMELLKMSDWLLSNPDKRKSQYRRFITNWLSRTQDKGGTKLTRDEKRKKELEEWAKEKPREEEGE